MPFDWAIGAVLDGVLERDPGDDVSIALALRGKLGYRVVKIYDRYLAPEGTELFTNDRTEHGLLLGVSPEIRFARLSLWRPAVRIGARAWLTKDVSDWAIGFPIHARLESTVSGRWSVTAETWIVAEWGAGTAHRFTGIGSETREPSRTWGIAWGLALGLEY